MNLENENGEITWDIKGFKAFSDLAMTFFPEYSNIDAASKRMRAEIENDESLFNALKQAHYTHNTTRLSPNQQYILISLWGPSHIHLHFRFGTQETGKNERGKKHRKSESSEQY